MTPNTLHPPPKSRSRSFSRRDFLRLAGMAVAGTAQAGEQPEEGFGPRRLSVVPHSRLSNNVSRDRSSDVSSRADRCRT